MVEDCFISWYEKTYPELDPSLDDFFWSLRKAYYAGWSRHMELEDALGKLVQTSEEYKDYG